MAGKEHCLHSKTCMVSIKILTPFFPPPSRRRHLHMVSSWNQHLCGLGTMQLLMSCVIFGSRLEWSVTLSCYMLELSSAWNKSCLCLQTQGQFNKCWVLATLMIQKKTKCCLNWFVGNCHRNSYSKRTQNSPMNIFTAELIRYGLTLLLYNIWFKPYFNVYPH